jgi:hypothetical protein
MKEDEDFVILPDEAWKYLFEIYGGVDLPRYSIELASDEDIDDQEETNADNVEEEKDNDQNKKIEKKKEYMIEIFYQ